MSGLDEIVGELGFSSPPLENLISWQPEDYDFHPKRINDNLIRADIYYKDNYELRKRDYNYWLCRKRITNERGNTEYLTRFYLKILPEEIEAANWLLTKGLK